MRVSVIFPAAGLGRRFTGHGAEDGPSKIEATLAGRAVFLRSAELFLNRPQVGQVIVAVNPQRLDDFMFRFGDQLRFHGIKVVAGGEQERWQTVAKALQTVDDSCTHVAVHDAARPLASAKLIDRVFDAACRFASVIPAMPLTATVKRVAADAEAVDSTTDPLDAILGEAGQCIQILGRVTETIDRCDLVEVQTPQVFEVDLLRRAYAPLVEGGIDGRNVTDDAALVERLGHSVRVVEGESRNIKITHSDDLKLAEAMYRVLHSQDNVQLVKKRLFANDDE